MCARFLFAVLPSELYWGEQTLRYMNTALADNLNKLYEEGIEATWCTLNFPICSEDVLFNIDSHKFITSWNAQVGGHRFYFVLLGLKGDWPYLRKVGVLRFLLSLKLFELPTGYGPLCWLQLHSQMSPVHRRWDLSLLVEAYAYSSYCRTCPGMVRHVVDSKMARYSLSRLPQALQAWRVAVDAGQRIDLTAADTHRCSSYLAHRATQLIECITQHVPVDTYTPTVSHMISNLRIGKDFGASGVVLLAKLKLFPGRSLNARLSEAFKIYMKWCTAKKKNTNIKEFSKWKFKMALTLEYIVTIDHVPFSFASL